MENIKSYLTFKVGGEYYASNVSFVHNIIEYSEITNVPHMPKYMLGVINLRGQVLPVVDTRIKFGIKHTEISSNTCILVMEVRVKKKSVFVGALIDSVSEVIEIKSDEIKDPPSLGFGLANEYITGIHHDQEKFIMLLDMDKVFSSTEILNMKDLAEGVKA